LQRWKLAPEAARERRQTASGGLAVLDEPVALPLPEARPEPQSAPAGARQTILVVEDDPRAASVIRESLELEGDAGWTVQIASEGLRALDLAGATPPDVVLLDVRLPDLDGAEVYRRLRASPQTRAARVLFLTAGTSLDLYQRGIEDGVLLRKPFDIRDLVGIVRALLAG
jgi:DNA-binding response OmpR family regulator